MLTIDYEITKRKHDEHHICSSDIPNTTVGPPVHGLASTNREIKTKCKANLFRNTPGIDTAPINILPKSWTAIAELAHPMPIANRLTITTSESGRYSAQCKQLK